MPADLARPALAPIIREIPADLDTPVSAYLKLARGPYSFLLESVAGGEHLSRYSFVGTDPYLVLSVSASQAEWRWLAGQRAGQVERQACGDPLRLVEAELARRPVITPPDAPRFLGGAVGYLGYECAACFEPKVPVPTNAGMDVPDALYLFTDTLLVFDHVRQVVRLVAHMDADLHDTRPEAATREAERRIASMERRLRSRVPIRSRAVPAGVAAAMRQDGASALAPRAAYEAAARRAQEFIRAGDCFQVVPSRRRARPTFAHPFEVYRALRSLNPSPYMFFLSLDGLDIAGASPELLVRVEHGEVEIHPIAGTRPRGATPEEDASLAADMLADEKERAEHVMLVDLGRNDAGRVCEPGTVRVTQFMDVERYSHVMHLVSHVTGRLRSDLTPFDALRAGFPAGTVTGAPKVRAMEILAKLEGERRGIYAGAVGYFGFDGTLDTCIALRTLVLKDGVAYAQAGAGVVYDSDPRREFEETEHKLSAGLQAIEEAERRCCC